MIDFKLFGVFDNGQTDEWTFCTSRVTYATEKLEKELLICRQLKITSTLVDGKSQRQLKIAEGTRDIQNQLEIASDSYKLLEKLEMANSYNGQWA